MAKATLLTTEERLQLPNVIMRRTKFKNLLKVTMENHNNTMSNCMIIQGRPGTGKTTLVTEYMDFLQEEGIISFSKRTAGHVTPLSLFNLLGSVCNLSESGKPAVVVLDDVDCLKDQGCLELMKAAFDSKSKHPTNRMVYYPKIYASQKHDQEYFKFNGMGIIITNDELDPKKVNIHQKALLDRARRVCVDFNENDTIVYNVHLIEKYLQTNEDNLTDAQIESIVKLFNEEIRNWINTKTFQRANINFSIRLVKKFADSQKLFGDDWKYYDADYTTLKATYDEIISEQELSSALVEKPAVVKTKKTSSKTTTASSKKCPYKKVNGLFINPKTNEPFKGGYQYTLKKKYA